MADEALHEAMFALADRFVTAVETYVNGEEIEDDPIRGQLEIIQNIHLEYHDRLETILQNNDQMKKMKALRSLSTEAKGRSLKAGDALKSLDGDQSGNS